jgi:hypothetical protein
MWMHLAAEPHADGEIGSVGCVWKAVYFHRSPTIAQPIHEQFGRLSPLDELPLLTNPKVRAVVDEEEKGDRGDNGAARTRVLPQRDHTGRHKQG